MSIVRLSVVGDRVFAPDPKTGVLLDADRTGLDRDAKFAGDLGAFPLGKAGTAAARFDTHLKDRIAAAVAKPPDAGPVIVLVHGFWYDPTDPILADKPQQSGNPHDRNYHFSPLPQKHFRHTSSWLTGLGIVADDEGEKGLAVAFGWDSTPEALQGGRRAREAWAAAVGKVFGKLKDKEQRAGLRTDLGLARDALKQLQADTRSPALTTALDNVLGDLDDFSTMPGRATLRLALSVPKLIAAVEDAMKEVGDDVIPLVDVVLRYAPELYKQSYDRAEHAAWVLANTLRGVAAHLPARPVHLFCHSLGSRVVLQALRQLAEQEELRPALGRIGRVVIVGGAEYDLRARDVLRTIENRMLGAPAVYNFMGRRDRVLTHIAGRARPVDPDLSKPIGCFGLGGLMPHPHWIDLQLDADATGKHALNKWLNDKRNQPAVEGTPKQTVSSTHPLGVLNHWYYFTNDANMRLFNTILRDKEAWSIAALRAAGIPENEPGEL
jgi:hypothetical protein